MSTLRRNLRHRDIGCALLGFGCLIMGWSWLPLFDMAARSRSAPVLLNAVVPIGAYAIAWILLGSFAILAPAIGRRIAAINAIGAMMTMWGVAHGLGWLFRLGTVDHSHDWISAGVYICLGCYVLTTTHLSSPVTPVRKGC